MHSTRSSLSVHAPPNASPDSVIHTLFSSASASINRCSFASDPLDRHSVASVNSLQLGGSHRRECCSGNADLDLEHNKPAVNFGHIRLSKKGEKVMVNKGSEEPKCEDGNESLDSARSSCSLALKEYQARRNRSGPLMKEPDRYKPIGVDMNNFNSVSPRLGMKKSSTMTRMTGMPPSPGTPSHRQASGGVQKGWCSERIPLNNRAGHRHLSTALLPYNNGRAIPSKWEDAERWICSPVSLDSTARSSFAQPQRRPKSKSGPLGPPGAAYSSLYSPAMPMFEGMRDETLILDSPFSSGIISAVDGWTTKTYGHGLDFLFQAEPCMARSASVHGCSDTLNQLSKQPQVLRKDMATQMSPEGRSIHSSPQRAPSFSAPSSSALPIVEVQSIQSSKPEIRDVQIDERVNSAKWSKKNKFHITKKRSEVIDDWKWKENPSTSAWDVSEKKISKIRREEAKITAWENLQKAKADAAIRKLEMKLEKKRSSSMDKIMNKLRLSQKKAQEMRSAVLSSQAHQVARSSHSAVLFLRRPRQISSLSGCFTSHAF